VNWTDSHSDVEWEQSVVRLNGHPLQSGLWGNARSMVDGIAQAKRICRSGDKIIAVARIETRKIPLGGKVAWIPRGPAVAFEEDADDVENSLRKDLKACGYRVVVTQSWREHSGAAEDWSGPKTIWIDLSVGEETLWKNLNQQWRYGVGRAKREGVTVSQSLNEREIRSFFDLCSKISATKGFKIPGSLALINELLKTSSNDSPMQCRFFVASHQGKLGAGAIVMRCGDRLHYLWGGVERDLSKYRTGEAVQWAVIKWGLQNGCTQYDLEGIDPRSNPGTYKFKKKMGGRVVAIVKPEVAAASLFGHAIVPLIRQITKD